MVIIVVIVMVMVKSQGGCIEIDGWTINFANIQFCLYKKIDPTFSSKLVSSIQYLLLYYLHIHIYILFIQKQ